MTNKSDDEVLELFAVSNSLSAEEVSEDADHNVVHVVLGVLDDGVSEEEFNSDILEAVGGEEECISVPFDDVSDLDGGLVLVALVKHLLGLFEEGKEFDFEADVFLLNKKITYVLELFEGGINLGLDEVEDTGGAFVLLGDNFLNVEGEEADQKGCEDDGFH